MFSDGNGKETTLQEVKDLLSALAPARRFPVILRVGSTNMAAPIPCLAFMRNGYAFVTLPGMEVVYRVNVHEKCLEVLRDDPIECAAAEEEILKVVKKDKQKMPLLQYLPDGWYIA